MVGKDDWCWERNSIEVDVGIEDVHGIEFIQKGYWVNVISTHDVDAYISQMDGPPMNLKIKVSILRVPNSFTLCGCIRQKAIIDSLCNAERFSVHMRGISWSARSSIFQLLYLF